MKQIFSKYIIIIIGIYTLWLIGFPLLFQKAVPIICENISYNSNYKISVEKPRLYTNIIPVLTVKSDSFMLSVKDSDNEIYIQNPNINLRILPLLAGIIHINSFQANAADISTNLNKNADLDKNFFEKFSSSKIICDSVNVNIFQIKFYKEKVQKPAIYAGKNVFYKKRGRYLKFNLESTLNMNDKYSIANIKLYLPKNNKTKKSTINVQLSNFDIEPLGDYLKNYLPKETIKVGGVVDLDMDVKHMSAIFKNCRLINKDEAKSVILPSVLHIKTDFNLMGNSLYIENAKVYSQNINVGINGKILNFISKSLPEINLDININKSKVEDFINLLPPFKTEDIDSYKLKKYKFFGDCMGNLLIKGDLKEPSVNGSIYIDNGVLTKPIPNAKGATIKLAFNGKYLNFDVVVPAGGAEKVFVKGGVELYNVKYSDMRVWSTKNVDLAVAEEKVVPIHEILNFIIGPVPIMDIKGIGNIDIKIKGNRKTPHVWGNLIFNNVTTHFYEIPDLILTNADAILNFDDENASFNLKKGLVNGQKINIDGTCNLNGKFDFNVKTNSQKLANLHKAIKTSTMIDDIKNMISPIKSATGLADLNLKVYGHIKDIAFIKFNENFFSKGSLELKGNDININDININNAIGNIEFEGNNAEVSINSLIGASPLTVKANVKGQYADAIITAPKLNLKNVVDSTDKVLREISDIVVNISAKYKGRMDVIEYDKLDFSAKILNINKNNKLNLLKNGLITLKNGTLNLKDINGNFADSNSAFKLNLKVTDISTKPIVSGKIFFKDIELSLINYFGQSILIPQNIRRIINSINFEKGKINANADISNNNINVSTNIGGVVFTYIPENGNISIPIKVINGSIYLKNNYLGLNKINCIADNMPILVDGGINNIFTNQDFNLYINSKPKQDFIDKYFNNNRIYPLKLSGDIVYSLKINGQKDNYDVKSEANLDKDSKIYYYGATVGDVENAIILNLNMNVLKQNILKIKEFSYDKLIASQGKRQTRLNMLNVAGRIDIVKDDLIFHDLRIKTTNPTDARIFNILFRKPNIKQGQFTSNLKFNGRMSNLHPIGTFHIVETNIPFFDTTMKNLSFIFKDKTIELTSFGDVLGNDISFKGTLRNKLVPPYYIEKAELNTKIIDLNYITNRLKAPQISETNALESFSNFDIKNTIINNIRLSANEVKLRNLIASDVVANASISDKNVFKVKDFKFKVADGNLSGNYSYNLNDNSAKLDLNTRNINANDISIALFDLNNQIYGNLTGRMSLSCNGADFNKCMETLNGSTEFNVVDGRMPKLGSLEYLLKAGNLVKGGVTGLSINSIVDVLTPLKTGNFSNIYGIIKIKDGIANDIEISTKGNDLSLFITGTYNFADSYADMYVFGLLSKKISTMFGPLGNVSLNTIFNKIPGIDLTKDSQILDKINKIPGIEFSGKAYRKFVADIKGDINGENYVKSFEWIN